MAYSWNPVEDAAVEMLEQAKREKEMTEWYKCNGCHDHFEEWTGGMEMEDEKFCKKCLDKNRHIEFYRDDLQIEPEYVYEIINTAKSI